MDANGEVKALADCAPVAEPWNSVQPKAAFQEAQGNLHARRGRRGEGRVFQRGNRWWIAFYGPRDGRSVEIREPGGRSEDEARKKLRARLKAVGNHKDGIKPFQGPSHERVTVEELLQSLERDYEIHRRPSRRRLSSHLKHVRQYFGPMRALAITEDRLARYVSLRQEQGAANATINRELEGLQRAFSLAKNKLAFAPTFPNLPEDNVREGFFDKADFFAVMQHVKDSDVRDFCEWGFWTGMRKGEIAALTWAAFNRESCTITLPGRSAKNRKPRTIPIRGDLEPIIQRRLAARRLDCPLIFHRAGRSVGDFRKIWKKACHIAGIGGHMFHDLRRTAVRNMVRAGVDIAVAMRISGHRTRSVFDRYNIVSENDVERALDMTQAYVRNLSSMSTITPLERMRTAENAR